MEWRDVGQKIASAAPLLGSLLAGPAGATVGALVASVLGAEPTPDAIATSLTDPNSLVKLRELEVTRAVKLQEFVTQQVQAELSAAVQNASDINRTMQAEVASSHWPSYTWRPSIGFAVAIALTVSAVTVAIAYVGVMFADVKADVLGYIPAMLGAMAALVGVASPILGIASWFRGKAQADPNNPIAKG